MNRVFFYLIIIFATIFEIGVVKRFSLGFDLSILISLILLSVIFRPVEDAIIAAFIAGMLIDMSGLNRFLWMTLCYLTIVTLVLLLKRRYLDFSTLTTQIVSFFGATLIYSLVELAATRQFDFVNFLFSFAINSAIGVGLLFITLRQNTSWLATRMNGEDDAPKL